MKSLLQDFGDYQILEKLGRGGMADVYLALSRISNQRVALKLVEHGEDSDARDILEAERLGAELQQRISQVDPRVPQIHAFGDHGGYFFIEMEFVEGADLSSLIGSGTLKPQDAARIAMELCSILRTAHDLSIEVEGRTLRAIVHGDIKPKNIRIDTAGRVRVLDFGIAKGLSITRRLTSNVFGSIAYSSPERLESGRIDEMSDLWSVGIVLYEMLEGRLPFEASSTERLETILRSRVAPRPLTDSCPQALQQIVYKALARSSESRYSNAAELESDLEAFLTGTPTRAAREVEQTRRTIPEELEETRRTISEEQVKDVEKAEQVLQNSLYHFWRRRLVPYKNKILAGSLILFLCIGAWEGFAGREAIRLKSDLAQGRLDGDSAWNRYEKVRKNSPLGFARLMLRGSLVNLLQENCEQVFNEYRNSDTPRVRENDWIRCKRYMSHAIELGSGDSKSKAMLEYANGHILRINRKSQDAIAAFQHAASLQPKWPDPCLGMARTYIYYLNDVDRGSQALDRAQQLGYSFGKRELAMMADASRARGLQALDNANLVRGTDREKEYLEKARECYNEALKTYLKITPWGNSTTQILSVQDSLTEVDQRIKALTKSSSLLPWNWFK
jgi:serine/threonine protein kinase